MCFLLLIHVHVGRSGTPYLTPVEGWIKLYRPTTMNTEPYTVYISVHTTQFMAQQHSWDLILWYDALIDY